MATHLKEGEYLGSPAYILENEYMVVSVLKDFGGKIASIYHKPMGFECLHQPTKGFYEIPKEPDFAKYDTSGLDDCFPTIDACQVEIGTHTYNLPDHGECWYKKPDQTWEEWRLPKAYIREYSDEDGEFALVNRWNLSSMPFKFTRAIVLQEEGIFLDYEIENIGEETLPCLWTLHGLLKIEKDMELVLPEGDLLDVRPFDDYNLEAFDPLVLAEYPKNAMVKFYLEHPVDVGKAAAHYPRQNVRVQYSWKSKDLPYLGIWATTGGFKNEHNVAIEPSNGFYDSVKIAMDNDRVLYLKPKEKKKFTVAIQLWPLRTF